MSKFLKKEVLSFGWSKAKTHVGFFLKIFLLILAVPLIANIITAASKAVLKEQLMITGILVLIAALVNAGWQLITQIGMIKIALKISNNEEAKLEDLYKNNMPYVWNFALVTLCYTLIVIGGMFLFVIPGLIWSFKYIYAPYLTIDKKLGVKEALKKSAEITQGAKWDIFLLGILICLINFLGLLCLFIGLLWTAPIGLIAMAYLYRKLIAQSNNISPVAPSTPATAVKI